MGDNVYLGDRNGVRTPMQWTGDRNAGFSKADPARLYAPPIMDSVYGYQAINVESQERSPYSLLNWMKRMIALRRQNRVFGRGKLEFLVPANRKILPYIRRDHDDVVLCVANLSRTIQPVELDLSAFDGYTPIEMLGQTEFPRISKQPYVLTIGAYGFCWFSLRLNPVSITARVARPEPAAAEQSDALFVGAAWDTLLQGSVRALIERIRALATVLQQPLAVLGHVGGHGTEPAQGVDTRREEILHGGPRGAQGALNRGVGRAVRLEGGDAEGDAEHGHHEQRGGEEDPSGETEALSSARVRHSWGSPCRTCSCAAASGSRAR